MTDSQYISSDSLFRSLFFIGNHTFYSSSAPTTSGVEVSYYDQNMIGWSSGYGSQSGSTFNVTSSVEATDSQTGAYQKVKGTFSCKVYNVNDPSQSKNITDGSFYLYIMKYQ